MFRWWTSAPCSAPLAPNSAWRPARLAARRPTARPFAPFVALTVAILAGTVAPAWAEEATALFDARGYRAREFRAPTGTDPPPGVSVIGTEELLRLVESGRVLPVDVLSAPRRPDSLPAGALWLPQPRNDIPGSLWLPDLGLADPGPDREARFRSAIEAALKHRPRPLAVYCRVDCWLSWNAAKRIAGWGIADVRWYPGGSDAWDDELLPTEQAVPAVRPEEFP